MLKHILFDNDGTIVDSEHLAVDAMLDLLKPYGFEISHEAYHQRFPGLIVAQILDILETEHGIVVERESFIATLRQRHIDIFENQLVAIAGMPEIFRQLRVPKSMVSNGSVAHVERCLRQVGLLDALDGHIFSGYDVPKPKPFPDVYRAAVQHLQLENHETIVVEDSPTGVLSAKAAGLQVVGFLGASHADAGLADRLVGAGADFLAEDAFALRIIFNRFGVM